MDLIYRFIWFSVVLTISNIVLKALDSNYGLFKRYKGRFKQKYTLYKFGFILIGFSVAALIGYILNKNELITISLIAITYSISGLIFTKSEVET